MTAKNLFMQIDDALAGHSAHVNANLTNIALIFAKLDERLAGLETKLDRLLAQPSAKTDPDANASARAKQLIALLDERIKAALDRDQRQRNAAIADITRDVTRDVLKDFVDEFKQVRCEVEAKLVALRHLLAERAPVDPRPN